MSRTRPVIRKDDKYFFDDRFYYAEPECFDVFSFGLVAGDERTALSAERSIVLTESMAEKYFEPFSTT